MDEDVKNKSGGVELGVTAQFYAGSSRPARSSDGGSSDSPAPSDSDIFPS